MKQVADSGDNNINIYLCIAAPKIQERNTVYFASITAASLTWAPCTLSGYDLFRLMQPCVHRSTQNQTPKTVKITYKQARW